VINLTLQPFYSQGKSFRYPVDPKANMNEVKNIQPFYSQGKSFRYPVDPKDNIDEVKIISFTPKKRAFGTQWT
jgi:hypothetical protein